MEKVIEVTTWTGGELVDDSLIQGEYEGSSYAATCTECGEPFMTIQDQEIYFLVDNEAGSEICEHCAAKLIIDGARIIDKREIL